MIAKVLLFAAVAGIALAQHYGAPEHHHEESYPPQPYEFGYETNDDYGTTTFRKESGDGHGKVQGSYGYKDLHGIERIVEYVADEHGYRAQIKTNEPGTESQNPADVELHANPIIVEEPPKHGGYAPSQGHPSYAAPSYGHAAPSYGHAAPSYGHAAPSYGHAAPSYPRY